ncbi:MAG: hypothetical protein IJQ17_04425 [Oscillospiraceae bacterium]|nr:hypothetical protein [Oscillospiraceae bacterium]MBQ6974050.1 hypothetical protein [Oscillospiraceae bacterium]
MTLHDFYVAVGGDYATAAASMGSDERILALLRAFPYAQDYAVLLHAMREGRWQDARNSAVSIAHAANTMVCPGLQRAGNALAEALSRTEPEGDVLALQESLAREYRKVIAAINGVTN